MTIIEKTKLLGLDQVRQATMHRHVLAHVSFLDESKNRDRMSKEWFDEQFGDQQLWFADNYPHLPINSRTVNYSVLGGEAIQYLWYVDFDDADAWMHYQLVYGYGA
jgi:hypothetical protein